MFIVFQSEFQIAGALLLMVLATSVAQLISCHQTSITRVLNILPASSHLSDNYAHFRHLLKANHLTEAGAHIDFVCFRLV